MIACEVSLVAMFDSESTQQKSKSYQIKHKSQQKSKKNATKCVKQGWMGKGGGGWIVVFLIWIKAHLKAALLNLQLKSETLKCKLANLQKRESTEFNSNICKKKFWEYVRRQSTNFRQYFHIWWQPLWKGNEWLNVIFGLKGLYLCFKVVFI